MVLPIWVKVDGFAVHGRAQGIAVVDGAAFLGRRRTTSDRALWYEERGRELD